MNNTMNLNQWVTESYTNSRAKGFHDGPQNIGEKIALMHSELSELLEAHRKDPLAICPKDERLTMEEEEVADLFLRLADYCGMRGIDLARAVQIKHEYNVKRPYKHGRNF